MEGAHFTVSDANVKSQLRTHGFSSPTVWMLALFAHIMLKGNEFTRFKSLDYLEEKPAARTHSASTHNHPVFFTSTSEHPPGSLANVLDHCQIQQVNAWLSWPSLNFRSAMNTISVRIYSDYCTAYICSKQKQSILFLSYIESHLSAVYLILSEMLIHKKRCSATSPFCPLLLSQNGNMLSLGSAPAYPLTGNTFGEHASAWRKTISFCFAFFFFDQMYSR